MRTLVTGCDGQVGGQLVRRLQVDGSVLAIDKPECDLTQPDEIRRVVRDFRPVIIVNTAAFTAVDLAEAQRETAFAINETAAGVLAEEAKALGAVMVHYSTDYVFDGGKQGKWVEDDPVGPLNVYGLSKLAGERAVAAAGGRFLIFRTSWVYGPEGKNFLLTMLRLGAEKPSLRIVDDQVGAPTTSIQLAEATLRVLANVNKTKTEDFPAGTYHLTAGGATSWCGFARAIFERAARLSGRRFATVEPIASSEYPTPALRPKNSALDNGKFQRTFSFVLEPWEQALDRVLNEMAPSLIR